MNSHLLEFNGPILEVRKEIVILLKKFPNVFFQEVDSTVFKITAESSDLVKLGAIPNWKLA